MCILKKQGQDRFDEVTKRQMAQIDEANRRQQSLDTLLRGFSNFIQTDRATALATAEKEKNEKAEKDKEEKEKKEQRERKEGVKRRRKRTKV